MKNTRIIINIKPTSKSKVRFFDKKKMLYDLVGRAIEDVTCDADAEIKLLLTKT